MNTILMFPFLFLSIASALQSNQPGAYEESNAVAEPYHIELQISKIDNENYSFSVAIELDKGCYIISPFSDDTTYGHFELSYDKANKLSLNSSLIEEPNSVETFDPIVGQLVKFVRENTTYKQQLKLLTSDDFELKGVIRFVLEPRCTPEEVDFIISYHAGEMKVRKV